jgi:hypothetical protein
VKGTGPLMLWKVKRPLEGSILKDEA